VSGPRRPAHAVTVEVRVAFHQCDPLGVVWHGRYFEYLEAARQALLASVDLDVPQIRALGFRLYVTEARCRYMAPLAYGDIAHVTAWFSRLSGSGSASPLIRIAYDVRHGARDGWCARAATVLATTDADGKLLPQTPEAILARLPAR
jgi:acyl-CoA thioester hydrolase